MHDLNASERQMTLNEVTFKKQMALLLKEINMHDLNASERRMVLNEITIKKRWPYYSRR